MNKPKQQEQDLPVWDSVEQTRVYCCTYFTLPAGIIPFIRNEQLCKCADMVKVHNLVTVLDKDVLSFKTKLEEISAKHQGKSGAASNANEHMQALEIAEAYMNWVSSYESVVLPTVEDIANLYAEAEERLNAAKQSAKVEDTGDVEAALATELETNAAEPGNHVDSINEVITPPTDQDSGTND